MLIIPYSNTKLTAELGELVESGVNIWDFEYESYYQGDAKTAFERKVIEHFYFNQIGQETVGRFKHFFRNRIQEIMPYYKQLYESVDLMKNVGDPFEAYNLTEKFKKTTSGQGSVTGSESSESSGSASSENSRTANGEETHEQTTHTMTRFSDTPQGHVDNLENYLTNATEVDGETGDTLNRSETSTEGTESTSQANTSGTHSTTSTDTGSEEYELTRRGNIGVQPLGQEMEYYRKALINVDTMIINELKDLFLLVF